MHPLNNKPFLEFLRPFITPHKREVIRANLLRRTRFLTIVLEDLFHAHNASACLRSCDGFGVQDVHIIENENPHVLNSDIELGSAQWLTLNRYCTAENNTLACLSRLREDGYQLAATSLKADALALEDFQPTQKTALLFGREMEGLSDSALEQADLHLRIPMFGFADSFNISVAVAICLHHITWKLRRSAIDWSLSEEESCELELDWVKASVGKRLPQFAAEFQRRLSHRAKE